MAKTTGLTFSEIDQINQALGSRDVVWLSMQISRGHVTVGRWLTGEWKIDPETKARIFELLGIK